MSLARAARPAVRPAPPKRRRVRERQESHVITEPGGSDKHRHCTTIGPDGNGETAPGADGHVHQVVDLEVVAAGANLHTHGMSAERCPAEHQQGKCQR